jgi:alpha-1,3-rhamnosyl/mannosyltransferase
MIPVAFDLRDPDRSGIARLARSLARALARRLDTDLPGRFSLTLCGPANELGRLGVHAWSRNVIGVENWSSGRHSLKAQLQWLDVRRRVGDAVWFFPHWDVPWYALPRRYVVMVNDLILLRVPGATRPARRFLAERWIRRAVRHAARVGVLSNHGRDDLAALVPQAASKIRIIPMGVDAAFFAGGAPLPPALARFAAAGPFMLSVGNRKRHKNLAAGVELLARIPALRWVVLGEWFPDWEEVESRAVDTGVAERIFVLDRQSDDILRALYHAAACLFFPSRMEGFGLPVIEAIACGTPVVCSNAASLPEAAGGCATFCDPDDVDAFEAAVRDVLARPRRQPAPCIDRVRRMTWDASAERLLSVLEEVA